MSVLAEFRGGILHRERRWLMWCDIDTVETDAAEIGSFTLPPTRGRQEPYNTVCPPGDEESWPDGTRYRLAEVLRGDGIAVYEEVLPTPA